MTPNSEKTVREIAIEHPASVRVFESLGIDYCCGGRRSLKEACERANVPVDQAAQLLAQAQADKTWDGQDPWVDAPFHAIIRHIVERHHDYIRSETPRLEALLEKVSAKHGEAHPELFAIQELFIAMSQELFAHTLKEEQVLFPYLEKMETAAAGEGSLPASCFGSVEFPIAKMLADHDDAGALTAQMRGLASNYAIATDACPSFRGLYYGLNEFERDLHQHIHLENNVLFPRAVEMERRMLKAVPVTAH